MVAMAFTVSANSIRGYIMSTTTYVSGPHEYMDTGNLYRLRYAFTLSGRYTVNDCATISCYKDEWTYATLKPDTQTFYGSGTAWWGNCEDGDYNLTLNANASGRSLTTSGRFESF